MIRKFLIFVFFINLAWGYQVEIKKSDVFLKINGNLKEYKAGEKFYIKDQDKICFERGEGRVVISNNNGYKKQLNKHTSKCKIMAVVKTKKQSSLKNLLDSKFSKSKENSVAGVSLMKSEELNDTQQENMLDIK